MIKLKLTCCLVLAAFWLGCATTSTPATVQRPKPAKVAPKKKAAANKKAATSTSTGPGVAISSSQRCMEVQSIIHQASTEVNLEPALMVGIVRTESNFRNDVTSKAGAKGLSQVMPATAKAKKCGDLNDPYENVLCGARVLKAFIDYYKGDLLLGLSGYNAGHGMPGKAKRTSELPANTGYIEKVLWARARYLSRGCDF
ncbi:MAG TPA: lytic transglycosylase domain-containing protein [Myxococcota bacterium]|jgi:soluble lytic murein transglycosylase-like protein|nr:lytic transglycosylase domain-containing protein [Oligoflexales bacterium]HOE81642.1 lytic transglycosylase domain-containing protein [Myxococcota bacterium]HON26331.1 lytic transglycosylase domain-containing protein [Myxococcota bacterium]HOS61116.1 lytic transglycosylase domain-containing protein [Myxococcota bacterium]HPC90742.1 lytic transglycosylase domain-containing protein [Myxococcota bacterium]